MTAASGATARIATVAVFTLLAPPLAGVLGTLAMLWRAILIMPEVAFMASSGVLFGYVVGIPPALLTGLSAAWVSPRMTNGWLWAGAVALIGAALSATAGPLFGFGSGALTLMQQVKLFAGCGGAAALMSALACLRFRPRSSPAEDGAQV